MPGTWLSHISIRLRLTVWFAVALMLGLGLFGLVLWLAAEQRLMAGVDGRLGQRLNGLQGALRAEPWIKTRKHLQQELLEIANGYPDGSLTQLRSSAGELVLPSAQKNFAWPAGPQSAGPKSVQWRGRLYRIVAGPLTAAGEDWTILVAMSLDDVQALMRDLDRLLLLMIPAVVGIASLGGYWLSLRALRPVDQITNVAKSIGLQNLSQRIVVPQTGDELQRMSETWNEVLARLESAVKRMHQFTADASHELRTPLTLIRSSAELALRRDRDPATYRAALRGVQEQAEYMTMLTESLLSMARMDSALDLPKEPLDLNLLLASVVRQNETLAAARQIRLQMKTSESSAMVNANDQALRRLLLVLLDNALKFTPSGGVVTAAVDREGDGAVVSVSDTGVGIAPESLPFIFDRFYRADPARENGAGFGLGLSIAQAIAQAHGATLAVSSTPSVGSRFSLNLKS